MNLTNLKRMFAENGCQRVYIKRLAPNDNSKNQVYLGGNFEVLNILPIGELKSGSNNENPIFKASVSFFWLGENNEKYEAKHAQLILYPQYPEVRFSGFLLGCKNAPSSLMTSRQDGRLLFLGIQNNGNILGYVVAPDSSIATEFNNIKEISEQGVFKVIELLISTGSKELLLNQLRRIHELGWINSKRLNSEGKIIACTAPQCGGYTLEAELGIKPNGYSEPDFLGWEIKQFGVNNFDRVNSATITLMTPEPTHGFYVTDGAEAFIRKYGYDDVSGIADRMNFGGIHKVGLIHPRTNLRLELVGFDAQSGEIRNADGRIALIDDHENETASWSFASLLKHWNRKHNQACYVPSLSELTPERKYKYGGNIIMGTGTDFQLFLKQMSIGNIYYDPGIKMENVSLKPNIKKRSQFRIKSKFLPSLYKTNEVVNI